MSDDKINILKIIRGTTVDGPGFRTSIYIAGCNHHCKGCHNPQSWDFTSGTPMTLSELMDVISAEDFDVTLSGGDPLYHPEWVVKICDAVHRTGHNIWIYTGFTWEEIKSSEILYKAVSHSDVVVDSPFILKLRDTDLLFRGSSNQRIIDVRKSIAADDVVLWSR